MRCVVITGANGFIGRWLVTEFSNNQFKVYAIVHNYDGNYDYLNQLPNVITIRCDLEHTQYLETAIPDDNIDLVYHLAWAGSTGALKGDYQVQLANTKQACDIALFANKKHCKKFICTGSIAELLISDERNDALFDLGIIYGIQKDSAYRLLKCICSDLHMKFIWARLTNIYGPYNTSGNLMCYVLENIRKGVRPVFTKSEQMFDLMYVEDTVHALYLLGISDVSKDNYLIGSGNPRPLKEYLLFLQQLIREHGVIGIGERDRKDMYYNSEWFDTSALEADTGFFTRFSFEVGIHKTLDWFFGCH